MIVGAKVQANNQFGQTVYTGTTNAGGTWSVSMMPDRYTFSAALPTAAAKQCSSVPTTVLVNGNVAKEIIMQAVSGAPPPAPKPAPAPAPAPAPSTTATVTLKLVSACSPSPYAINTAQVDVLQAPGNTFVKTYYTDGTGQAIIKLKPGTYSFKVTPYESFSEVCRPVTSYSQSLTAGQNTTLQLTLPPYS